jgi:Holliday junction DNA helicase RuvA
MISRLRGTLLTRTPEGTVEVETGGGVVYEVDVPLTVLQRLPSAGSPVDLRTLQVVRPETASLYGFLEGGERELFKRLLGAPGVGARLALSMMSAYPAARLARALAEKDVNALKQVSGVGKKTAEKLVLDLSDKMADLALGVSDGGQEGAKAHEAVAALVALGFSFTQADEAVRLVLENGAAASVEDVIRKALARR